MSTGICALCSRLSGDLVDYGGVLICADHQPGPPDEPSVGWCATGHWGVGQYQTKSGAVVCRECYFRPLRKRMGRTS